MGKLQSDVVATRDMVRRLFLDETGMPLEGMQETIEDAYRAREELLEIASEYDGRKTFTRQVVDRAGRLAIWKTLTDPTQWLGFLADLQDARIVVRHVENLKRAVEAEFSLLMEDAQQAGMTSEKVFILENVKEFSAKRVSAGVQLRVEVY